jgi:aryl-alcohol dehydrogenase-like predicted oxidoreductase
MQTTIIGRTGLTVTRTSFGVLPIQRTPMDEAVRILRRAHEAGITFYDTARGYSDSEEKLGAALSDVRGEVVIATKCSGANTRGDVLAMLETSLRNLRTDYVDILQLHNPAELPNPDDPESTYAGLLEAQRAGKVRFIGITQHSRERADAAVRSGLYDTLQFPLCHISAPEDLALVDLCREANVGVIGMKALSGGLITNARAAFAFLQQYANVVPIWGIQRMEELEEFIALDANPPALDDALLAQIETDRRDLAGEFCRACGYCLPCPAGIPIPMAARMALCLRRMPAAQFHSDEWRGAMARIHDCIDCGHCRTHCPYGLDTPALLRRMLADYEAVVGAAV